MASPDGTAKGVSVGSEPATRSGGLLPIKGVIKMQVSKQRIIRPCPICHGGRDKHPKIACWACLGRGTIHDILDRATRKPYRRNHDS